MLLRITPERPGTYQHKNINKCEQTTRPAGAITSQLILHKHFYAQYVECRQGYEAMRARFMRHIGAD